MSDTKISNLASGTPATLADELPIRRGTNNNKLTVQQIMDASALLPAFSPAAATLTDILHAARASVSGKLSVQDVLTAISLLTAAAPAQAGDILAVTRAGVAKSLLVDDLLSLAPKRNYIDNGGFELNQRGGSGNALTTAYAYGPVDRWAIKMATSAAGTGLQQTFQATGEPARLRLNRTVGSALTGAISTVQAIETIEAVRLQGKTVTLVWKAQAGANFSPAGSNMGVRVATGTGTDQGIAGFDAGTWTGQADAVNASQAITTTPTFYFRTFSVPAGATEIAVQFNYTPTGTAGADDSLYLYNVGLFEGSNPPANFGQDPLTLQLLRSQRYMWAWLPNGDRADGFALSATGSTVRIPYPVRMRAPASSIIVSSFAHFALYNANTALTGVPIGITFNTAGVQGVTLQVQTTAGSPTIAGAGVPISLIGNNPAGFIQFLGGDL